MISGGIISKYLPVEAQVSLLSELVQAHRFDEVVGLLDATQLTADSLEEIGRQILELLENELAVLSGGEMAFTGLDEELCLLSQLIGKIGSLEKLFQSWISGVLVAYVQEFSTKLFPDGASRDLLFGFLGNKSSAETSGNFDIIVLLRFLSSVCLYSDSVASICVPELEMVLIALLGCSDETIASMSSNLMRWRVRVIAERCSMDEQFDSICWLLVQQTLMGGPGGSWKQTNGLSFLLRFLTVSELTPGLETFVKKEEYWTNLQAALNDDVQEYRKIGLSVLKMTIKKIPEDMGAFSARMFSWDPSKKVSLINSWRGFTTLYEIVSLDTALNQIEAASEDILNLFQDSNLHSTWGLLLFSTGFRASMESVRKYMIALFLRVRVKSVIAKDLVNLRNIFLPSLMEAHFFTTDGKSCRYGEKLAQFVAEVLWESGSDAPLVIKAMLETLVDQGASFDPARVYLSLGILDFLEKQEQKPLTSTHLQMITKLYEVENEDAVFETTIQTIYLKYALHISPSVSPREWIKFLVSHIKRKEGNYAFISPLLSSFKTFASNHFTLEVIKSDIDSLIGMDETTDLLALLLFDYREVSVTRELLIETARSKQVVPEFTEKILDRVLYLIMTPGTDSLSYESSAVLVGYPELDFKPLMTTELRPLFDSLMQNVTLEKLEFFVAVYKRFVYSNNELFKLSWSLLVDLYHSIESQIRDSKVANYKIKDETYGSFFELLHFFLEHSATQPSVEVAELIDLLHRNINRDNGNPIGNEGVAKLSAFILKNCFQQKVSEESWSHVLRIFDMLTTIWDSFSCERLVLKQKGLHLATINGLFHPTILLYASSSSSNGRSLSKRVHSYGKRIIQQAYSRRSMLPLISKNILLLMREHGDKLENTDQDHWWIIDTMIDIFTCEQTSVNMFRLKTVIADLFDNRLSTSSSLSRIYEDIYGVEEVSAKIWIIDSLLIAPQRFKDSFIMKAFHSTNLLTAKKKTDGAEEIQRLLGWQLTLLCFRDSDKKQLISTIPKLILKNLLDEVSPVIRIYMEWFIALLLSHSTAEREFEDLTSELFSLMDDHSRPIVVVSAERIIFLILKAQISNKSEQFDSLLIRFISVLVPNATSSKPLVRHFSNSLMLMFWPAFQEHIKDSTFRLTMEGLYNKAIATKLSGKYRAGDATAWDIYADLTLIGIFGGVLKKTLDHDLPYISKGTFIKFLPSHVSFPLGEEDTSNWLPKRITRGSEIGVQQSGPSSLSQLQTKSGAWETLMMLDNEDQNKAVKRSDLIVVSSLVDKPPNLGGICRLCDVLGVGLLTVQDIRVKNHPQFKNVAVTADRWMPMVEVPLQSISDFMLEKKREGYTLIGLEQTDKSVKLDTQYKFPKKSLILLGTEAHGIPGELLNQLDLCLEIQQFGVIRSMNIQTATAVIVHSYTIQHM